MSLGYAMGARAPSGAGVRSRAGFTLIELMAVVVILLLVSAIVLPNLGLRAGAEARDEANELASALEFARQRSVVTGRRHEVVLDLDDQTWWVESERPMEPAQAAPAPTAAPGELPHWTDLQEIPLSAPPRAELRFSPMTGVLGKPKPVRKQVTVQAVQTAAGVVQQGRVAIRFAEDGAAEATSVQLVDAGGGTLDVEVAPLLDTVRIAHGQG